MERDDTPHDHLDDHRAVAERFSAAAEQYARSEQRGGDDLDRIVELVAASQPALVVDVATGPGSTALALAPVAGEVLGTDVSPGMLTAGTTRAAEAGLANVRFAEVPADALGLPDGAADAVVCRIAAHHFPDVPAALAEWRRVLRPGGRLVVLDSLAPDDPGVAAFLHELEVTRDPTHVRAFTRAEWEAMVGAAGFTVDLVEVWPKPKAFDPWVERGGADAAGQARTRALVRAASPGAVAALAIEVDEDGEPVRFADDKLLVCATAC